MAGVSPYFEGVFALGGCSFFQEIPAFKGFTVFKRFLLPSSLV